MQTVPTITCPPATATFGTTLGGAAALIMHAARVRPGITIPTRPHLQRPVSQQCKAVPSSIYLSIRHRHLIGTSSAPRLVPTLRFPHHIISYHIYLHNSILIEKLLLFSPGPAAEASKSAMPCVHSSAVGRWQPVIPPVVQHLTADQIRPDQNRCACFQITDQTSESSAVTFECRVVCVGFALCSRASSAGFARAPERVAQGRHKGGGLASFSSFAVRRSRELAPSPPLSFCEACVRSRAASCLHGA